MISHIGKVSLECYKTIKGKQREEVEGEIVEKDVEATLRFDFIIPMGSPFEIAKEVLQELLEEVNKMEETSQKQREQAEKKEEETKEN